MLVLTMCPNTYDPCEMSNTKYCQERMLTQQFQAKISYCFFFLRNVCVMVGSLCNNIRLSECNICMSDKSLCVFDVYV